MKPGDFFADLPPEERDRWRQLLADPKLNAKAGQHEPDKEVQLRMQTVVEKERQEGKGQGVRALTEYQRRPVDFITQVLEVPEHTLRWSANAEYKKCRCDGTDVCRGGAEHRWDGDPDPVVLALEAMARGESVGVTSATGTGKTFGIAAAGALWWLGSFQDSIVLSIAPRHDQLLINMWKEMGRLFPAFQRRFPSAVMLTGKLRLKESAAEKELWAATAFGAGVGADEEVAQRLAGSHHPRMLWLLEDMPGIHPALLETIINTAVGEGNLILGVGNPDSKFDTLCTFAAKKWVTSIRISALDHPNIVCGREVIPGAVSRRSIKQREDDYGRDSPIYLSRARGIPPEQAKNALIQRTWCEEAAKRYHDPTFRVGSQALGVDPANSETHGKAAVARWLGACLTEVVRRPCSDASVLGKEIVDEAREAGIAPLNVGCDSIGNAASTVNKCKELEFFVRALNGSSKPETRIDEFLRYDPLAQGADPNNPQGPVVLPEERYWNLRAQMYWLMREDLRLGRCALPNDPELFDELCIVKWEPKNGKILLGPKEEIIELLKRSPDKADAAVMGNWVRMRRPPELPPQEQKHGRHYDNHFEEMMSEMEEDTQPFVSRRPF